MPRSRALKMANLLPFLPLASRGPVYGRLLLALARDPRVPASRKALLGLAAAYVLSPWDLIPERLPYVGALDDVAVVVLAVDVFLEGVPQSLIDEKLAELDISKAELEQDLQRVRRMVPKQIRGVASRVPDALEGIATAYRRSGLEKRVKLALAARSEATTGSTTSRRRATSSKSKTSAARTRRAAPQLEEAPA